MISRRVPGSVGTRSAREFVLASNQYLEATTGFGLGTNEACAILLWVRRDANAQMTMAALGTIGSTSNCRRVATIASSNASVITGSSTGTEATGTSLANSFLTGPEYHAIIGEFAASNSRRIIVDGVAVTNTTSRVGAVDPTAFRVAYNIANLNPLSGGVAQVAVVRGTVTDAAIARHAQGWHPLDLNLDLLEVWDFNRIGTGLIGLKRGTVLTPANGGGLTIGPRIQSAPQWRRLYVDYGAGVGGGTTGTVATTTPAATAAASGSPTVTGTAATTATAVTTTAAGTSTVTGTASTASPSVTGAAAGTSTVAGTAASLAPAATTTATGTATVTGTAAISAPAATAAAVGTASVTGTVASAAIAVTASAAGTPVVAGTVTLTTPVVTASAAGYASDETIRAIADITAGGWTPSTGTDLFAMLTDTLGSGDSTYIRSPATAGPNVAEIRLSPMTPPGSRTVRFRIRHRLAP